MSHSVGRFHVLSQGIKADDLVPFDRAREYTAMKCKSKWGQDFQAVACMFFGLKLGPPVWVLLSSNFKNVFHVRLLWLNWSRASAKWSQTLRSGRRWTNGTYSTWWKEIRKSTWQASLKPVISRAIGRGSRSKCWPIASLTLPRKARASLLSRTRWTNFCASSPVPSSRPLRASACSGSRSPCSSWSMIDVLHWLGRLASTCCWFRLAALRTPPHWKTWSKSPWHLKASISRSTEKRRRGKLIGHVQNRKLMRALHSLAVVSQAEMGKPPRHGRMKHQQWPATRIPNMGCLLQAPKIYKNQSMQWLKHQWPREALTMGWLRQKV